MNFYFKLTYIFSALVFTNLNARIVENKITKNILVSKDLKNLENKNNLKKQLASQQVSKKNYYLKENFKSAEKLLSKLDLVASAYCVNEKQIKRNQSLPGIHKNIILPSSYVMPTVYFNRSSDVLLILGPGLNQNKESLACFVEIFNQYDILVFDYRWKVNKRYKYSGQTLRHPFKKMLYDEVEEIEHAVKYGKSLKNYEHVIGLGECYSTFLMALAQSRAHLKGQELFTKLIFDSCWLSIEAFAQAVCQDPFLPFNSGRGGCPRILTGIFNFSGLGYLIKKISKKYCSNINIRPILSQIRNTPILFIHGKKDLFVPKNHFNEILAAAQDNLSLAIFTPYAHSVNVHDRHIYKFLCEKFIEKDFKSFKSALKKIL